jgi:membrane fusion protein (multidrug efflux system)
MAESGPANSTIPAGGDGGARRRQRSRRFLVFGLVLLVALAGGGVYWWLTRNDISTDDAFLEADVSNIAARIDAPVVSVSFSENQWVEKGQVLVQLDPTDYQVAVDSAKANLATAEAMEQSAEADLALTKTTSAAAIDEAKGALEQIQHEVQVARQTADASAADAERAGFDVKRYSDLVKTEDASRQRYEQAVADARGSEARLQGARRSISATETQVEQAQARLADANAAPQRVAMKEAQLANATAQVAQAQAAVRQAELNLSYTKIVAPVAGRITKKAVEPGNVLQRGQILADLVADPPWVVANFKETQIARMRPGMPVSVRVDAASDLRLKGHVDSIQPGSGSRFTLLPPENATGNYVKVVQRVPVRIVLDGIDESVMHRLGPGMSVVPTVDVSGGTVAPPAK